MQHDPRLPASSILFHRGACRACVFAMLERNRGGQLLLMQTRSAAKFTLLTQQSLHYFVPHRSTLLTRDPGPDPVNWKALVSAMPP